MIDFEIPEVTNKKVRGITAETFLEVCRGYVRALADGVWPMPPGCRAKQIGHGPRKPSPRAVLRADNPRHLADQPRHAPEIRSARGSAATRD